MTQDPDWKRLIRVYDLTEWTPIALQNPHAGLRGPRWMPVDGAPLTIRAADRLQDQGLLLKAQKVIGRETFVVVKMAKLALTGA